MSYHLVCVNPFGKYVKGQKVTDHAEVASLMKDRDHHFVRIHAPAVVHIETVADPVEEAHHVTSMPAPSLN